MQQLLFFFVYLISVTFLQGLDIALPIFFVFSLIPFLSGLRSMEKSTFILMCAFCLYLLVGTMFQNTQRAIIMFVSRCWQFLFFFVVYNNRKRVNDEINYRLLFSVSFALEGLLAGYLYFTKRGLNSVIRLTAGAQPITGNIAIVILPILCFYYFRESDSPKEQTYTILMAFLMMFWVALSGTRGYELVFLLTMLFVLWDYVFRSSSKRSSINRVFAFAILSFLVIGLLFVLPQYLEKFVTVLRINKSSVGIRTYENAAALDFYFDAPILVKLFGVGIGGKMGSYPEFVEAINKQFSLGMWNRNHYLNDSGSLFHNLFVNILCNMGIVGIILLAFLIIKIWKTINKSVSNKRLSVVYKVMLISVLVMNFYRWSTDCGIAVICIFTLLLKASAENNEQNHTEGNMVLKSE